MTVDNLK